MSQICQSCDIQILEEIRKFSIDNHIHQEVCGHPKNTQNLDNPIIHFTAADVEVK